MNLEDEIVKELSEQVCSRIDFEILSDVLVNAYGWHKISLERFQNNKQAIDITVWCQENTKGNWKRNGCHFIFEDIGDAVNFTLLWRF